MIEQLRVGLKVFRILTSVLNVGNDQTTLSGLDEVFRILTFILNVEDDQMALSGLDEVFRSLTSILNVKDDEPGSIYFCRLVLVVVSSEHR